MNSKGEVTFIQACAILGVTPSRLHSLIGDGYLHPIEGNFERIARWEVEHLVVSNRMAKRRHPDEVQFALPID